MQRTLECFKENGYSVKHVCISTEKHPFDRNAYPEYVPEPETVFISTKLNPFQAGFHLLKGRSYHLSRFESGELEEKLKQLLQKEHYDVIFLESLYSAACLDVIQLNSNAKIVIRTHNAEFVLWERIAALTKNPLKKWYISKLSAQLKKEELSILNSVDAIATLSSEDSKIFQKLGVKTTIGLIPIALPDVAKKTDYSSTTFFHLGSMNWKPNREAVQSLLENIFPLIQNKIPDAYLKIAGSFMSDFDCKSQDKNVEVLGFIEDAEDFFRSEGIFLSPIQSGSGVRVKILEAMNLGTSVITTKIGAEGIHTTDGIIIAKNQAEFVQSAIDLYLDEEKRKELGTKAFQYIRENHSIKTVASKLNDFLRSI